MQLCLSHAYLVPELFEIDGLLSEWFSRQTINEGHHAMGEVVLRQPCHYFLLLHVWSRRHIDDQVAKVLPVSARTHTLDIWVCLRGSCVDKYKGKPM